MGQFAVAKRERLAVLNREMGKRAGIYAKVLPPRVPPDRFVRGIVLAATSVPQILECDPDSIFESAMRGALLGLEYGDGGFWIVPYGKKAQFQADYRGLIKLALQHPTVASIECTCVYADEPFELWHEGGTMHVRHKVRWDVPRDAEHLAGAYGIAHFTNGAPPQTYGMSGEEIEKVLHHGRADSDMKHTFREEFYRKTVIKRLCKTLPRSTDLERAIMAESLAESGHGDADVPGLDDWKHGTRGDGGDADGQVTITVDGCTADGDGEPEPTQLDADIVTELGALRRAYGKDYAKTRDKAQAGVFGAGVAWDTSRDDGLKERFLGTIRDLNAAKE